MLSNEWNVQNFTIFTPVRRVKTCTQIDIHICYIVCHNFWPQLNHTKYVVFCSWTHKLSGWLLMLHFQYDRHIEYYRLCTILWSHIMFWFCLLFCFLRFFFSFLVHVICYFSLAQSILMVISVTINWIQSYSLI